MATKQEKVRDINRILNKPINRKHNAVVSPRAELNSNGNVIYTVITRNFFGQASSRRQITFRELLREIMSIKDTDYLRKKYGR